MAIITEFPPRLAKAMKAVSREVGKPFIVKTNHGITAVAGESGKALYAEAMFRETAPIYITNDGSIFTRTRSGVRLTAYGEAVVAHEAMHFAAHMNKYPSGEYRMAARFTIWDLIKHRQDIKLWKERGGDIQSDISNFAHHLIVHNITGRFGYDIIHELQLKRFDRNRGKFRDLMKNDDHFNGFMKEYGLKERTARMMYMPAFFYYAEIYMYMPQATRRWMDGVLGGRWKREMDYFFNITGLHADPEYLLGKKFASYYTPERYKNMILTLYDFADAGNGNYFPYFKSDRAYEKARYDGAVGKIGTDPITAYEELCSGFNTQKAFKERKWALDGLMGLAYEKLKLRKEKPVDEKVAAYCIALRMLLERGSQYSAMMLQDDLFGESSDIPDKDMICTCDHCYK